MFNESGIADEIGNGLWAEWASTASFMRTEGITKQHSSTTTQQSPLQLMYNTQIKGFNNLLEPSSVRCVSCQPRKPFKED
jgi:hypothetical protein